MMEPRMDDWCARDTTEDATALKGDFPRRMDATTTPLAPLEVCGYDYSACDERRRPQFIGANGYRTLSGSVPTAKLAMVAGFILTVAALLALLFGPPKLPIEVRLVQEEDATVQLRRRRIHSPVLRGVDVVAYRHLVQGDEPIFGSPEFSATTSKDYTFWFASEDTLKTFQSDPARFSPQFGGFCAFGISSEFGDGANKSMAEATVTEGWPWSADHLGPPANPKVWRVLNDKLYVAFLPEVMDLFEADYDALSVTGETRWNAWFETDGPFNNECVSDDYGPPVTRTCTFQQQGGTAPVDDVCSTALRTHCGNHFGDNPVNNNACSRCLHDHYHHLKHACPTANHSLQARVDKTFCW